MRRPPGPAWSLVALASVAAVWAALEVALPPPAATVLQGGHPAEAIAERWAPCCRTEKTGEGEFLVTHPWHARVVEPVRLPLRKSAGTFRLAVVGESSAFNLGNAISRRLAAVPSVELLNCASGGASLLQTERRWDEVQRYSPDAVIVVFGHNLTFEMPYLPPWRYRLNAWLSRSRVLSRAAAAVRGAPGPVDEERKRAEFESFAARATEEAARRGQRLLFCTVPSNPWASPPPRGDESRDPAYLEAAGLLERGEHAAAIKALTALAENRDSPFYHFQVAGWLYRKGDYAAARRHFDLARRDPRSPTFVSNEVVARATAGGRALLIDSDRLLAEGAPHGIPGAEAFLDDVHLKDYGPWAAACLRVLLAGTPHEASWRGSRT